MDRRILGLACIAILPLAAAPLRRPYTVENYDVSIRADLANQRLNGEVKIRFHSQADTPIPALELDAGGLQIASVAEGQAPQYFERNGGVLAVVLTNPLRPDEHRTITVRYEAGPAPGLRFFADQIYTTAASDWMPCNDRPDERATLRLSIAAPPGAEAAASGQRTTSEGENVTKWLLDNASAPSRFGFAVGRFTENASQAEGVKLRNHRRQRPAAVLGQATFGYVCITMIRPKPWNGVPARPIPRLGASPGNRRTGYSGGWRFRSRGRSSPTAPKKCTICG